MNATKKDNTKNGKTITVPIILKGIDKINKKVFILFMFPIYFNIL
jgi:hypothetical protein